MVIFSSLKRKSSLISTLYFIALLIKKLNNLKKNYPKVIKEIRGIGLLIGIKVNVDLGNFINKLTNNKLLTIRAAENVVRILPPLNVKKREIDQALKILNKVCSKY